jgi:hypothetical protein
MRGAPGSRPGSAARGGRNGVMKTLDAWIGWMALATLVLAWSLEARWLLPGG